MTQEERVTLYALGALDPPEVDDLRRELAESPHLQSLLARERELACLILASVEPIQPRPGLKQRLMEQIDASGDLPAATPAAKSTLAPSPRLIVRKPRPEAAGPSFLRLRAERPRRSVLPWVFAAFMTVAALAAIALTLVFATRLQESQQEVAQLQTQAAQAQTDGDAVKQALGAATARAAQLDRDLAQTRADLAETQQALTESRADTQRLSADLKTLRADISAKEATLVQTRAEMSVLLQPNVRTAALPGVTDGFRGITVTVFYAPQSTTAYVSVIALPSLPADRTYQLWLIKRNQPQPSSVFNTDTSGMGRLIVNSAEPFSAFQNVSITVEPAGGSPTPNPEGPIIQGRL